MKWHEDVEAIVDLGSITLHMAHYSTMKLFPEPIWQINLCADPNSIMTIDKLDRLGSQIDE